VESARHGNVIGQKYSRGEAQTRLDSALTSLAAGAGAKSGQFCFERDRQLLEFFDGLGIRPGAILKAGSSKLRRYPHA